MGIYLLFVCFLGITDIQAQTGGTVKVNLDVQNTSLIKIIESLRMQTRYNFLFNSDELSGYTGITVKMQSVTLKLVMLGDSYKMLGKYGSAKGCYNQALVESYQIDMKMTQLMIQNAVLGKLGELELLQQD